MSVRVPICLAALLAAAAIQGCGDDSSGEFECRGSDCVCPSSGDCRIDCAGECDLRCAGSGACDFSCGDDCDVACTGSGPCAVSIGDAGDVACTGSGGCDVACGGDCAIDCPGSGACIARCEPGFTCTLQCPEGAASCPDGVQVCNRPCPNG